MAHDVFISYSFDDQKIVEGMSAYLEQNGIRCWIAYRDIPAGKNWADFILQAIIDCKTMVYVHSEKSNISKEIDKEIALCLKNQHPIIPFWIENINYLGAKSYHLETINWIDAFPNPKEHFGKLLTSIKNLFPELENKKLEKQKKETDNSTIISIIFLLILIVLGGFLCSFVGIIWGICGIILISSSVFFIFCIIMYEIEENKKRKS